MLKQARRCSQGECGVHSGEAKHGVGQECTSLRTHHVLKDFTRQVYAALSSGMHVSYGMNMPTQMSRRVAPPAHSVVNISG